MTLGQATLLAASLRIVLDLSKERNGDCIKVDLRRHDIELIVRMLGSFGDESGDDIYRAYMRGLTDGWLRSVDEKSPPPLWDKPISILEMPTRAVNCFAMEGIKTIGDLMKTGKRTLLRTPNFGSKSMAEVERSLAELGLTLPDIPRGDEHEQTNLRKLVEVAVDQLVAMRHDLDEMRKKINALETYPVHARNVTVAEALKGNFP